jgi:hypothetical protein
MKFIKPIKLLILIPVVSVIFSLQADLRAPNTPQADLQALNAPQSDIDTPPLDLIIPEQDPTLNMPQVPLLALIRPQLPKLLEGVVIYSGKAITMGANTIIYGNANTHSIEATTIGAGSKLSGDIVAGAAVTLGAGSEVSGNIVAGAAVTPGASAKAELTQFQKTLSEQVAPLLNELNATLSEDKTLLAGVYHAANLTTTAGITITFDGENKDGHWLINVDDYIAFGAGIKMNLKNVTASSTITWSSKGYISIGAGTALESSEVLGTLFATNYISTGAEVKINGIGNSCGGLYTTNGYVTLGAENTIGSIGCEVSPHPTDPDYFSANQSSQ